MKRIHVFASLAVASLALCLTGCSAQNANYEANVSRPQTASPSPTAKISTADAEKELTQIERDWAAAIVKRDTSFTERHMADDGLFVAPDGAVSNKAQAIEEIKSGDLQLDAIDIKEIKVKVYGDTAVVTYQTSDKGKYKGQDISGDNRWIDVFVRRDGKWQTVAAQGTRIMTPPPAAKKG